MSQLRDPKFTVHAAVTICAAYTGDVLWRPGKGGKPEAYVPQIGEDKEICQMAAEFPRSPTTEKEFRAAFKQMENACVDRARTAGLIV